MAEFKVASAYADFRVDVDAGLDAAIAKIHARQGELDAKAKVVLDADTAMAKAKIKELEKDAKAKVKVDVDEPALRKTEQKIGDSVSKVAQRANAQFSALTFAGLSLGLPAAAVAGVAGVGIALAAAPALFAGIAIAAQSQEPAVRASLNAMGANVSEFVADSSKMFRGPLLQSLDQVQTAFNRNKTIIANTMADSAAAIKPLVGGVTDFAENIIPGMNAAVRSSGPVLQGWRSLLGQTGTGVSEFFANTTAGAESAGQGLSTLGGIFRDALSFAGQFFAQLSNASAGPLTQLQAILRTVEGTLIDVTASGSGVLGFLSGFTGGATGMLGIVRLLVAGLSLLPPQLTQFAGTLTATAMVAQKFGLDIGKGFEGLGTKIKEADGAGAKFKAGFSGLADGVFSPTTLAVAGLSIGLGLLGQHEADAAAAAQAHAERVQSLAQALRESNGALNENVHATAATSLQQFKMSDGVRNLLGDVRAALGDRGVPLLTEAYLGNAAAGSELSRELMDMAAAHTAADGSMDKVAMTALDLHGVLDGANSAFGEAVKRNQELSIASGAAYRPTGQLAAAMVALTDSATPAADRVTALKVALDSLAGRTPVYEDSIKSGNDQLRTMAESLKDGAKQADGFGMSLLNADGTINTVSKNGSGLQALAEGLQGSFVNAASGIDQMVRSGVPLSEATRRVNGDLQTQRDRFIELAGKFGITGKAAQDLADKYGLMPKEISTDITANIKKAQVAIDALPVYAAGAKGSVVISANTVPGTNKIDATVQYADGSLGVITLDGNKDPVTGKIMTSVQYADGSRGTITVDAAIAAAKAGTLQAVRYADGSTGFIKVAADMSSAAGSVNSFINQPRYLTLRTVVVDPGGAYHASTQKFNARGGIAMHDQLPGYAGGGAPSMIDIRPGGLAQGPGTPTSDSMVAMGRISDVEFVVNAKETARNISELWAINSGKRNYEQYPNGGRPQASQLGDSVDYGTVSQSQWDSLYSAGWRGSPNDGREALYRPAETSAPAAAQPITINIYPPADMDYPVIAAHVSRELSLRGK